MLRTPLVLAGLRCLVFSAWVWALWLRVFCFELVLEILNDPLTYISHFPDHAVGLGWMGREMVMELRV